MFALANPVTFKYFTPFLVFYVLLIVFSFLFKLVVPRLEKQTKKMLNKSFSYFAGSCFWVGVFGLIYLGARKYNVYFLSMEFLHIVNGLILVVFFGFGLKKYIELKK